MRVLGSGCVRTHKGRHAVQAPTLCRPQGKAIKGPLIVQNSPLSTSAYSAKTPKFMEAT